LPIIISITMILNKFTSFKKLSVLRYILVQNQEVIFVLSLSL